MWLGVALGLGILAKKSGLVMLIPAALVLIRSIWLRRATSGLRRPERYNNCHCESSRPCGTTWQSHLRAFAPAAAVILIIVALTGWVSSATRSSTERSWGAGWKKTTWSLWDWSMKNRRCPPICSIIFFDVWAPPSSPCSASGLRFFRNGLLFLSCAPCLRLGRRDYLIDKKENAVLQNTRADRRSFRHSRRGVLLQSHFHSATGPSAFPVPRRNRGPRRPWIEILISKIKTRSARRVFSWA